MLKYTFPMDDFALFSECVEKLGTRYEFIDGLRTIIVSDYEIATVRSKYDEFELCANELTGPGSTVLELIGNFEDARLRR